MSWKQIPWKRPLLTGIALLCCATMTPAQQTLPVIDMHLHADPVDSAGPPPAAMCAPYDRWPAWDPKDGMQNYAAVVAVHPPCAKPLLSPTTDADLMQKTLAVLRARNVTGVTSGPAKLVDQWHRADPQHILPALYFNVKTGKPTVAELRELVKQKHPVAFAEIDNQYLGIGADDPRMEPYYALAEELDIPIGMHMGPGPPGTPYFYEPGYRMRFSSMLLLEDVLVRHPKLRLWAMHAGYPLGDDAIAAMYAHPQLYVDTGIIDYAFLRPAFYAYLKKLIDAGFEDRILFGSDQMIWPEAVSSAIDAIQNAPDLTAQQKRDILYNNAARFLRLPK